MSPPDKPISTESSPRAKPEDFVEVAKGTPYAPDAFAFALDAYRAVEKLVYGSNGRLTGQAPLSILDDYPEMNRIWITDFSWAAFSLAIDRWGLMGDTVLRQWGIHSMLDFGRVAEILTNAGVIPATDVPPGQTKAERLECYQTMFSSDLSQDFTPEICVEIKTWTTRLSL